MKVVYRCLRWAVAVICTGCMGAGPLALKANEARPLNVLFIMADDLRTNLGCFGDPLAHTPHLDRLAARGVVFDRAYVQATVCNPSRQSALTGRRPDTIRVWELTAHFRETSPGIITLPQYFKQHGYFSQNIGKIYHGGRTFLEGDPESWSVPALMHWSEHNDDHVWRMRELPPNLSLVDKTEQRDVPDEAYLDGRVSLAAIEALRSFKTRAEPFFLAVGFRKPHLPFNAPKRYWDLYPDKDFPLPAQSAARTDVSAFAREPQFRNFIAPELSPAQVRTLRRGYYAATSYLDTQVGKVIAELDRLDLAKTTIIVFWSDHGFHLGEHGLWNKTTLFERDARVPLIIALPEGTNRGRRSPSLVEMIDLYPTLVELCGLPRPAGLDGTSLAPILHNPKVVLKRGAITQSPRPWRMRVSQAGLEADTMGYSVRTDRWRYTEWREWDSGAVLARELYDHACDPSEAFNRAGDPAVAATIRECAMILKETLGPSPGALSFHPSIAHE